MTSSGLLRGKGSDMDQVWGHAKLGSLMASCPEKAAQIQDKVVVKENAGEKG